MMQYEEKLQEFLNDRQIEVEHLVFEKSCHSVAEAAEAAKASPDEFVKNICMIGPSGEFIVAIVKGEDNASSKRIGKSLNIERPRPATPEEILERTGFPCGGTPSFGFDAIFLIDPKVLEKEIVYTGGGFENSLVKISSEQLVLASKGTVVRIRR